MAVIIVHHRPANPQQPILGICSAEATGVGYRCGRKIREPPMRRGTSVNRRPKSRRSAGVLAARTAGIAALLAVAWAAVGAIVWAQSAQAPAPIMVTLAGQSMIRSDIRDDRTGGGARDPGTAEGDVVFTNLEAAVAEKGETIQEGRGFLTPPEALDALEHFRLQPAGAVRQPRVRSESDRHSEHAFARRTAARSFMPERETTWRMPRRRAICTRRRAR